MANLTPTLPRLPGLSLTGVGAAGKPAVPDLSKLTAGQQTPAPTFKPNIAIKPGSIGPGGQFMPATTIAPDTGYAPTYQAPQSATAPTTAATPAPKPAMPTMPISPAPSGTNPISTGAHITTPSGAVVNQFTGALVSGPVGNNNSSAVGSPVTPTVPAAPTGPGSGSITSLDPSINPLTSSSAQSQALQSVKDFSQMTPRELEASNRLNDLNSSFATSYTNTAGQPIPLPFITGQQAQLQRSQAALAVPLEGQIKIEQANRGLGLTGATTALGNATGQLSTLTGLNTKSPIPFGSSTFTPVSGAVTGGGVFGTNGSSSGVPAAGTPFDASNPIDQMVQTYLNTGSMPANIASMPQYAAAITQRANDLSMQQTGQPFNPSARSAGITADTTSLNNIQKQFDQSTTSLQTIKANGALLLEGLTKAGLNASSLPLANAVQQAVAKGLIDPGEQAAFTNSLNTLQSEYAKMLMGTGVPTDQATSRAQEALPSNLSASQLAKVLDRMVGEGVNSIGGLKSSIDAINKRISPYNFSGSKSGNLGTGGSSSNPFSAENFFGSSK